MSPFNSYTVIERILSQAPKGSMGTLIRYAANCGIVLLLKLGILCFGAQFMSPMFAYAGTIPTVMIISYFIHFKFTFKKAYSYSSFFSYTTTLLLFPVIDYCVFAVGFAYFQIEAVPAVLTATIFIFILRFLVIRTYIA